MKDGNDWLVGLLAGGTFLIGFAIGGCKAMNHEQARWEKDAISRGVGTYQPVDGTMKFQWTVYKSAEKQRNLEEEAP